MKKNSLKEQLYILEQSLLRPVIRKSAENLNILISDDFVEFGSSGRIYNKSHVINRLPNEKTIEMTLKNFKVKLLAPDVALTTFYIIKEDESNLDTKYSLRSSVWRFIEGRWQIVFHQGTPSKYIEDLD